jgi:superfamily II DNA/RNA helicase
MSQTTFADLHLPDELLRALERNAFETPTPAQLGVLPKAREGRDLLVRAATGSGKTAAYLLPMLERFHDNPAPNTATRGLILAPTRELAKQIRHHFLQLGSLTRLTASVITGGHPRRHQVADLRKNPDIIIATPGRLLEHLENGHADLSDLEVLVIDEADRMLDMGFAPEVLSIIEVTNRERQSMLFSATLDQRGLKSLIDHLLKEPESLLLDSGREQHPDIHQQAILADDLPHKQALLSWLASNESFTKAVVFANMRETVKELTNLLQGNEIRCAALQGEMEQRDRNRVMDLFRRGEIDVLIATDVAARGLDIAELDLVINFDMPRNAEELLHRTGRTGRAGASGRAISLVTAPDWNRMISIERYLELTFERRLIEGLEAKFKGPRKQKSSGKASGKKPPKPIKKEAKAKPKQRLRDRKNIGKRRKPSSDGADEGGAKGSPATSSPQTTGFGPLKRKG